MDVLYTLGASSARVVGPMTRAILAPSEGPTTFVGVRFRPGAAVDLLGFPARELLDDDAPVADVWGANGRQLDARLADARTARAAIDTIQDVLARRIHAARMPDPRVAFAVDALRTAGGELPIPAVSARVGLSERQLERLFHERIGYGPKLFARVVRLQRGTRAIHRGSIASWARLAIDCGYTDQAHLVREFRALTGVTPAIYARERTMSEIDNLE
jgi:AraC-like DNA-binding protein